MACPAAVAHPCTCLQLTVPSTRTPRNMSQGRTLQMIVIDARFRWSWTSSEWCCQAAICQAICLRRVPSSLLFCMDIFLIFGCGDNSKATKAMSQIENTSGDQQHLVSRPVYPPPPPYFALASAEGKLEPPPPIVGEYPLFGEVYTTEDGIPALNVRRLYDVQPDGSVVDVKRELLKLHEELKLNITELLDVLIERPSAYGRQVENVGLVLRNMMHLTNRLRPIQAEMAAIAALTSEECHSQLAVQNLKEATQQGKEALKKVLDVLKAGENEQMVE